MEEEKPRSILRQREPFQYSGKLEKTSEVQSDVKGGLFFFTIPSKNIFLNFQTIDYPRKKIISVKNKLALT